MRAEQIRLSERSQHTEERFGATDFVAEKLKGMGQGMANRKPERPQPKRIQENVHLMPDADGAVLEIAIIETEPRIDEDFRHAVALGDFDLAAK